MNLSQKQSIYGTARTLTFALTLHTFNCKCHITHLKVEAWKLQVKSGVAA